MSPSENTACVINFKDKFYRPKPLLEEMKVVTVYHPVYNIFQTLTFVFNYKNKTVPLILQNIFSIKPRNKYTIKATNLLIEVLCRRNLSEFKISFCRSKYYYYYYYYYY